MENYICIGGRKVEFTEEQLDVLLDRDKCIGPGAAPKRELKDVPVGGLFKIGEHTFIVLEHTEYGTSALLKDLIEDETQFGESNNFDGSTVDEICGEFAEKLEGIVGEGNLLPHDVDLTADDGLKDYGTVERKVSLLTAELYRRYVYAIDMHKVDAWWWLATPHSTPTHCDYNWVKCVSPSGGVYDSLLCNLSLGVRPFWIFVSSISVSCEE